MMISDQRVYLRNPDIVAIGSARHYLFVDARGGVTEVDTSRTADWSLLMRDLMEPMPGSILRSRQLAEEEFRLLDQMLALELLLESRDTDTLLDRRDRVFTENTGYHFQRGEPGCGHLVMALTGSVVSGLMAPVILSLAYCGFQRQLDLILTEAALRFVTRDLFESYGIRTWVDPFERRDGIRVAHVGLGTSADCLLVMPASANALHRLADASCTDLLSITVAASNAPVVIVPAMNDAMWGNAGVQRNAQRLRDDGMYVVDPTLIFAAATLTEQGASMYGGPGTLWRGPLAVMQSVSAVIAHHNKQRKK
jgi:hypothetical protein